MNQSQRANGPATDASSEGRQPALTTRVLLQRLKLEAALKAHGAAMKISGDEIRLKATDHSLSIAVTADKNDGFRAQIEALAGEVLLDDGLREFLRVRNEQIAPIQIKVGEDRVVRVSWTGAFENAIAPARVIDALQAVGAVVESL